MSVPWLAVSVSRSRPLPASMSASVMALPVALPKLTDRPSPTSASAGALTVGASLTAAMSSTTSAVATSEPPPMLPPSSKRTDSATSPLAFGAAV